MDLDDKIATLFLRFSHEKIKEFRLFSMNDITRFIFISIYLKLNFIQENSSPLRVVEHVVKEHREIDQRERKVRSQESAMSISR